DAARRNGERKWALIVANRGESACPTFKRCARSRNVAREGDWRKGSLGRRLRSASDREKNENVAPRRATLRWGESVRPAGRSTGFELSRGEVGEWIIVDRLAFGARRSPAARSPGAAAPTGHRACNTVFILKR